MGVDYNIPLNLGVDRKYHIVRFFPKKSSYEFINIAIIIYDNQNIEKRVITEKHLTKLSNCNFINNKIIKNAVANLKNLLYANLSKSELISNLKNRYKNSIDTSFSLSYRSNKSIHEVSDFLYNEYIGYKFQEKIKKDKIEEIKEVTNTLLHSEFKSYFKYEKSQEFDFSLINKKNRVHNIIVGSLLKQDDIKKALFVSPFFNESSNIKEKYDFFYVNELSEDDILAKRLNMLEKGKFNPLNANNKDNIVKSLEIIVDN